MRKRFLLSIAFVVFISSYSLAGLNSWMKKGIDVAAYQLGQTAGLVHGVSDTAVFPRSIINGNVSWVSAKDWTSGFFPGSLWYAYELTGNKELAHEARRYTNILSDLQYFKGTHDLGFMMFCSYGNAIRLIPQKNDSIILVNSAESLSSRFSPKVGLIRSWDFGHWSYPVIIDNMMNLEMLFWASKVTGDKKYKEIAISHANKTMKYHFRPNMSTYHVVSYNADNGNVESRGTFQGYSDSSAWARGQAWGVYGYTVCYRETKDKRYLNQARKIAAYIMSSVKTRDLIPYWDYNAPKIPNEPRDASAAAVTASALLELSQYVKDGVPYIEYAEKVLKNLSSDKYLAKKGQNCGFILKHSVGSLPHNSEVDVPLNYADYYYLEGLVRLLKIKNGYYEVEHEM